MNARTRRVSTALIRWATFFLLLSTVHAEDPSQQHMDLMKSIATSYGTVVNGVYASREHQRASAKLSGLLYQVRDYWKERDQEAANAAEAAAGAANNLANVRGGGEIVDRNKAIIAQSCQTCHNSHRVGPDGGPYKIK